MSERPENLGARFRHIRKMNGMTLKQVGDRMGVSKARIWQLENNQPENPTINTVIALARALDVSLSYLIGQGARGQDG